MLMLISRVQQRRIRVRICLFACYWIIYACTIIICRENMVSPANHKPGRTSCPVCCSFNIFTVHAFEMSYVLFHKHSCIHILIFRTGFPIRMFSHVKRSPLTMDVICLGLSHQLLNSINFVELAKSVKM